MNCFPDKLLLEALAPDEIAALGASTAQYRVTGAFSYQSALLGTITVEDGLVTDFASIPRAAWSFMDPEDPVILFPSVVHDNLYSHQGLLPGGLTYTREQADSVLVEAMAVCGASWWQCKAVYAAVRAFGGSHWGP